MNIAWKPMDDGLLQSYRAMVLRGKLALDPAQALAAEKPRAIAHSPATTGASPPLFTSRGRTLTVPRPRSAWHALASPISTRPRSGRWTISASPTPVTLIIDEIPVLGPEQRNAARRLIILIDALSDNGVGLIASAAAEPQTLYLEGNGARAFARKASRLMEMRSRS
jgi:cell division protein ZapE